MGIALARDSCSPSLRAFAAAMSFAYPESCLFFSLSPRLSRNRRSPCLADVVCTDRRRVATLDLPCREDGPVGEIQIQVDLFTNPSSGEHKVTVKSKFVSGAPLSEGLMHFDSQSDSSPRLGINVRRARPRQWKPGLRLSPASFCLRLLFPSTASRFFCFANDF